MKWFRLYSEVLHDPKVQRLSPALFKHWINLLCLANEQTPRGTLPAIDDIAFALRVKPSEGVKILTELGRAGLVDQPSEGRACPHNWPERQRNSDDIAARVRHYRNGKEPDNTPIPPAPQPTTPQDVTLHVTLQDGTSNVLDTDTEEDKNRSDHIPAHPAPKPGFAYQEIWDGVIAQQGYKPTWNYTVECKAVKRLLSAYPNAQPDDFVRFLAYIRTCWPWVEESTRQPTFSESTKHFGAWQAAGQPDRAIDKPRQNDKRPQPLYPERRTVSVLREVG